jgi:hypothetical protein
MQMACFIQSEDDAPRDSAHWMLVPSPKRGSYTQIRDRLADLDEAILIGILNHPGYLALWRIRQLGEQERQHAEHNLRNQQKYFDAKVGSHAAEPSATVLFEGRGVEVAVPGKEVREGLGQFAFTWGWSIGTSADAPNVARIVVLQNLRRWSPGLNASCSV